MCKKKDQHKKNLLTTKDKNKKFNQPKKTLKR